MQVPWAGLPLRHRGGLDTGGRHPRTRRRTGLALAALISSITILVACNVSDVLTPDGTDSYQYAVNGTAITVSAPTSNTGGNLREVFWDNQAPAATDSQSCATWQSDSGGNDQEGIALHITDVNHVIRAVTVTKNIWSGFTWNFNFHVWDTSQSPGYTEFGWASFFSALSVNGVVQPFPWHVCARIIGSTLETKAWLDGVSEPAWDDPTHSASITVPSGWLNAGSPGWYVGHLWTGDHATFTDLSTSDLDAAGSLLPTTAPTSRNAAPLLSRETP